MLPTHTLRRSLLALVIACGGWLAAAPALALQPDQIALVVNRNQPVGLDLARFYMRARHLPDDRILTLDLPTDEQMPFEMYDRAVVPAVRAWLASRGLADRIKCLVTFYGVPLRIAPKTDSPAEEQERQEIRRQLLQLNAELPKSITGLEDLARQLDPAFHANSTAGDFAGLFRRGDLALHAIEASLPKVADAARRQQLLRQMLLLLEPLTGDAARARRMVVDLNIAAATQPAGAAPSPAGQARRDEIIALEANDKRLQQTAHQLEDLPFDPQARAQLRQIVLDHFGGVAATTVLRTQLDYLTASPETAAAFDSELSLVRWSGYSRQRWQTNPLFYPLRRLPPAVQRRLPPAYMVMRLDAPQPDQVKRIIADSLRAEATGLQGQVVIDSQGLVPAAASGADRAKALYDQSLRDLGNIVRQHTSLKVLEDDRPEVLPPHSATDVALYCGWYSLRHYVPECQFNPGAVGYHVASFELVSLHTPGETGWVAGLLNDGVAATLGPVAEPYLQSFPRPDDFFPLLLSGKLQLAEVYWYTTPMASWMQTCIGDPLYTPYAAHPALSVDALPDRLKPLLQPGPGPASTTLSPPAQAPSASPSPPDAPPAGSADDPSSAVR